MVYEIPPSRWLYSLIYSLKISGIQTRTSPTRSRQICLSMNNDRRLCESKRMFCFYIVFSYRKLISSNKHILKVLCTHFVHRIHRLDLVELYYHCLF